MSNKYLLDNIVITTENNIAFKTYSFKYARSLSTSPNSFLKEIIETGSDGNSLNSTIFKYGDAPTDFSYGTTSVTQGTEVDRIASDINGDGFTDIISLNRDVQGNIVYYSSFSVHTKDPVSTNNTFNLTTTENLPPNYIAHKPYDGSNTSKSSMDFNGDGASDLIFTKTTGTGSSRVMNDIRIYLSPTTGTSYSAPQILAPYSGWNIVNPTGNYYLIGDFNGDGRGDILTMLGQNSSLYRNAIYYGGGSFWSDTGVSNAQYFAETDWAGADKIYVLDFNGDGKDDIMVIRDQYCEIFTFTNNQTATSIYHSGFPTKWHHVYMGDFNGDGKTDILTRTDPNNNSAPWYISLSTGIGFITTAFNFNKIPTVNSSYYGDQITIIDFNQDGKSDIAHCWNYISGTQQAKIDLYTSTGISFAASQFNYPKALIPSASLFLTLDSNGDGRADFFNPFHYTGTKDILFIKKEGQENLLQKVKNGFDHTTEFQYKRLTQTDDFYIRGNLTSYPLSTLQPAIYLTSKFRYANGVGGNNDIDYNYEGLKIHREGKGSLGFAKYIIINQSTGHRSEILNNFNTQFYSTLPSNRNLKIHSSGASITSIVYNNEFVNLGNKRFWPRVNSSTEYRILEGSNLSSSVIYDNYGNITESTVNHIGFEIKTTTIEYGQHGTPIPSKLTLVTEQITRQGETAYSKSRKMSYNSLGQLTQSIDFFNLPKQVTTSYQYNTLGNQTITTISASGVSARTVTNVFDTKGRYVIQNTDPLGHVSYNILDARWGKPTSITGIDGLTTTFIYDGFGRVLTQNVPQGYSKSTSYTWEINQGEGTIYKKQIAAAGHPTEKIYYDILDREKRVEMIGFQNLLITNKKTYDSKGNLLSETQPYKSGESILTTSYVYDQYNRISTISNSIGSTIYEYSYLNGNLTTTITNPASQVSSKIIDGTGKLISSTDYSGTIQFTYYSHGSLKEAKRGSTVYTFTEYDDYARRTKLTDIDAGVTEYTTNALGQTTSIKTATNQSIIYSYDLIGRITYYGRTEGSSSYQYFTPGNGSSTGKVKKISTYGSKVEDFTYDAFGRLYQLSETIDGLVHTKTHTYKVTDQLESITYPSGFTLNYSYDSNGYLHQIKNGSNSVTLFTANEQNGLGQFKSYSLGNGKTSTNSYYFGVPTNYSTPGIQNLTLNWNYQSGNLNFRNDVIKGKTESFTYDNLNRLKTCYGTGLQTIETNYDNEGNFTNKTDVGVYAYHPTKIHAIAQVSNVPGNISSLQQSVQYSSFYQPLVISENNFELTYQYGSDDQRIKSILKQNANTITTRYYFGDYEKDITAGVTRHIHYISSGQGLISIVERIGSTDSYYYTYTDHLGSILAVTNSAGNIVAEQNFDAWGRNRNVNGWYYSTPPSLPAWLYRGFTGHEHLPQFGLINMNGRLYDPILGRMLGADNFIQSGDYSQNYNRFSYVYNNPLTYTDPDGEWIHIPIAAFVGGFLNWASNGMEFTWKGLGHFGIGAVQGAAIAVGLGGFTSAPSILTAGKAVASVISSQISSHIPSLPIKISDGITLYISPAIVLGSGFGAGVNFTLSIHNDYGSINLSYGFTGYFSHYATQTSFLEQRFSGAATIGGKDFNVTIGSTSFFGGGFDQNIGLFGIGGDGWSVMYENDWNGTIPTGDRGDRFRTTGASIQVGDFSVHLNMFTGDPGEDRETIGGDEINGYYGTYIEKTYPWRLGAMSVGYKGYRIGWNSEGIRDFWQNKLAHGDGCIHPRFEVMDIKGSFYSTYQRQNPYTTW